MCLYSWIPCVSKKTRSGHWIPWSWSYKWFWSHDMNDETQIWVFWKGNWAISLAPQLSSWRPMACMNFKGNCTQENCVQYHMLAEGGYGITNKNVSEKNGLWKNLPMQLTKISKWIKGEQVETITFVPLYLFTFSEGTCFFVLETCCVSTGTGISF